MFLAIWIGFGIVTAIAAQARGRSFFAWLAIGLLTGVFGLIAVLVIAPAAGAATPTDTTGIGRVVRSPVVEGLGAFNCSVDLNDAHRAALDAVCSGPTQDGCDRKVDAYLVCEATGPSDAPAVTLLIDGRVVGHLPAGAARAHRTALAEQGFGTQRARVAARVRGGRLRPDGGATPYTVDVDLPIPPRFSA